MENKRTILTLNCAIFVFMFGVGLITPLLPARILNASGSTVQVGWLASAFACSYLLVQVPIGMLADRYGFTYFIALGYFVCGIAGIIYLNSDSSFPVLIGRTIQGGGEAPLWALAPALLSLLKPAQKARIIGWYNACLHIGLTSGSIFGFAFFNLLTEQQVFTMFILLCTISGLITLSCKNKKPTSISTAIRKPGMDRKEIIHLFLAQKTMWVLVGITLYGAGYGVHLTIIPSFFLQKFAFSHTSVGWLFIGFYVGISLAQLVGGFIADKKGRIVPMIAGLLLFAGGQFFFHTFSMGISIGLLALASFGLGLYLIGSITFLNDLVGDKSKGLVTGLFYLFWGFGYFVGPLVLGYAGGFGLYLQSFACLAICALVTGIGIFNSNFNRTTKARYLD